MRHEPAKKVAVGFHCPVCNSSKASIVEMIPTKGAVALRCEARLLWGGEVAEVCGWPWVESSNPCSGCGKFDSLELVTVEVSAGGDPNDDDPNVFEVDADGFYVDPQRQVEAPAAPTPVAGLVCAACGRCQ